MTTETPHTGQPDAVATVERQDLQAATIRGVRWVTLSRIGVEAISFLSSIALARLISPSSFGRVAVTLFVVEVASAVNSNGLGAALVQRKVLTREEVQAELAFALILGLALTAALLVLANLVVGGIYGQQTVLLFEVVAPVFLFVGPGSIAAALLSRRMDFKALGVIAVAGQGIGLLTTLALAIAGAGALAVILGQVISAVIGAVLQIRWARLPLPAWRPHVMREMASFGIPAGIGGVTYAVQRNIDYAIVGARLGALQTGLYWRAFNVASEYPGKVTLIMQQLALPVYSRTEDVRDMRVIRRRIVRLHATVLYPCLALLIALAPVLVPWMYGPRWTGAVLPIELLSVATVIGILSIGIGPLLLASGMARTVMVWNFLTLGLYIGMLLLTVRHGIDTICLWTIATTGFQVAISLYLLVHRRLGIPLGELLGDVAPATVGSLAALGAAVGVRAGLVQIGAPAVPVLLAAALAGAAAYWIGLSLISSAATDDLKLMVRSFLSRRRRLEAEQPS